MERQNRMVVVLLSVLTVVAVGTVLKQAQSVILPLVIAWLLSFILGPVVNFFTDRRIPTPLAVILMLTLLLGVIYVVTDFLQGRVVALAQAYPAYEDRLAQLIDDFAVRWKLDREMLADIKWGPKVQAFITHLAGGFLAFLSNLVMVIIFLVFLLVGKPYMPYKIRKAFSKENADSVGRIMHSIAGQIGRYLSIQFVVSLATGILVWAALAMIGVDFPVTWGAMAFFLNFIPTVGSIIASVPPVIVALVQYYPDKVWPAVVAAIALLTIQMLIGNVLAPKVMGDQLNLSPVVVLLSLIFFGWMWGVVGALLSIPIASIIKIVCENLEPLHPISVMMGSGKVYSREFRD